MANLSGRVQQLVHALTSPPPAPTHYESGLNGTHTHQLASALTHPDPLGAWGLGRSDKEAAIRREVAASTNSIDALSRVGEWARKQADRGLPRYHGHHQGQAGQDRAAGELVPGDHPCCQIEGRV